ncbi:MAG: CehA/McbA family metallohydrolase [Planctomycetales bacterium]|nr:CehA/McbA family metallohydrolase [Planctomycetales bacterium]
MTLGRFLFLQSALAMVLSASSAIAQTNPLNIQPVAGGQIREVANEQELRGWLENMVWYHNYSAAEIAAVTGIAEEQIPRRLAEFGITAANRPARANDKMLVLPYPGGRHPRIGFLDGAIAPQRETKLSVFCPWDADSYAVLDFPEAVWSNLGLTYLAHTHIDTIWTKQRIALEQLEWQQQDGNFTLVRRLPNGIEIGIKVIPLQSQLRMKMWLTNGTAATLSDLRVQNCIMLKGAAGFEQQTNDNKVFKNGYALVHSADRKRWMISSWDPGHRTWGNANCPCLHADPKFPDCPPGETRWLRGWFSFYEGSDIEQELTRIESTGWKQHPLHHVTGNLVGQVRDAGSKELVPSRLYVQNVETKEFYFARSTAVAGSAITYDKQLGQSASIERHTSLSADGFQLDVPPGTYSVTAMLGKEYRPTTQIVEVGGSRVEIELPLERFANMADRGWYSGDTHVHRRMDELPTAMLAEDLNVCLPLNYWVRDSRETPTQSESNLEPAPIYIDSTHVIYPLNTEYEIFTVDGKRHTQGAVFVLNHQQPLQLAAPPVAKIAEEARRQAAILDLDKHSWNWSMMIVPVMKVDLFELSNNHHWQTQFGFPRWTLENAPPDWPEIERDAVGFTERGWTHFGFETYYSLLNCGYRLRVSAGTASGVHPVPLGYGRVYVHVGDQFSYDTWIDHLNRGQSFVTQGPLMDVRFNGQFPGATWRMPNSDNSVSITGTIESKNPLSKVEVICNGEVVAAVNGTTTVDTQGVTRMQLNHTVRTNGSSWVALRCFETSEDGPGGKLVFAHTNPVFIDVDSMPLRPRRRDVEYFYERMKSELNRNAGILSPVALAEYQEAKAIYEKLLGEAVE